MPDPRPGAPSPAAALPAPRTEAHSSPDAAALPGPRTDARPGADSQSRPDAAALPDPRTGSRPGPHPVRRDRHRHRLVKVVALCAATAAGGMLVLRGNEAFAGLVS
ncbi:hypothetical protein ACFXPJ_26830, partial [Streptomyces goshikiensis]